METFINILRIYNYLDYRTALAEIVSQYKKLDKKYSYLRLADAIRVQAPYISKVFSGQAHFDQDQVYLICNFLKLSTEARDYLLLLNDFNRTGLEVRRKELKSQIEKIQNKFHQTENRIQTEVVKLTENELIEYYMNPLLNVIFIALSIEQFSLNPSLLGPALMIRDDELKGHLDKLQSMQLIRIKNDRIYKIKKNLHLPTSSPFIGPHQNLMRQEVAKKINQLRKENEKKYNLMATFSANDEAVGKIKTLVLETLEKIDQLIELAPSENVYQLNVDLFNWLE